MPDEAATLPGRLAVGEDLEREFETRIGESSTLAFRVAFSVLRQREDAEDVAQDALAKAYRSFRSLRDPQRFRAWLVRMTWRLALDRQRASRRRTAREQAHASDPTSAGVPVDAASRDRLRQVWQAIDALPETLRLVVVLANIEGHTVKDVAAILGLPEGTVKSRLFLARARLKAALEWIA